MKLDNAKAIATTRTGSFKTFVVAKKGESKLNGQLVGRVSVNNRQRYTGV